MKYPPKMAAVIVAVLMMIISGCEFMEKPEEPENLTAVYNATDDYVELHWDEVTAASEYKIFRGADENSLVEIDDNDSTWFDDFDYNYLEPYYAVKAKNDFGTSDFGEIVLSDVPELDKWEPDNAIASASTVDQSSDSPSHKGSIRPTTDVDFIEFYAEPCAVGVPCGYNLEVPVAGCDLNYLKLELYDVSGNLLESDDAASGNYIARIGEFVPTTAGYYYVKISGDGSEAGYYTIFIIHWSD